MNHLPGHTGENVACLPPPALAWAALRYKLWMGYTHGCWHSPFKFCTVITLWVTLCFLYRSQTSIHSASGVGKNRRKFPGLCISVQACKRDPTNFLLIHAFRRLRSGRAGGSLFLNYLLPWISAAVNVLPMTALFRATHPGHVASSPRVWAVLFATQPLCSG